MKILYCKACQDLFKLTRTEKRSCKCNEDKVWGRYCADGKYAKTSLNEKTISIVITNPSLKSAIKKMQRQEKHKRESTRDDYKRVSGLVAYVRPNSGHGNPRSNKPKRCLRG